MPKKSKCSSSSSSSSSCSLCSVTGLSSDSCSSSTKPANPCCSSSSSSCPSSSSSSCSSSSSSSCSSSSSSSSCPSSSSSSSCPSSSSSSLCGSSSSVTYTSNSSSSSSTTDCSSSSSSSHPSCSSSSSSSSSNPCGPCEGSESSCATLHCVKRKDCDELVKNYNKCRDVIKANSDMVVILEFVKNKLKAVKPNIDCRDMQCHTIQDNVKWLECFVDTVLCVLRKNEAYKVVRVKDCKVKNNCDEEISDRLYVIKAKYSNKGKSESKTLPLNFYWTRLTYNDAKSFKGILDYTISEIDAQIVSLKAQNTRPFLH